jgi:hypothetical protein
MLFLFEKLGHIALLLETLMWLNAQLRINPKTSAKLLTPQI